jgi:putative ABC transport system permease protein
MSGFEIGPILATLRRNRFGAVLIAAQIAITLGFLANALSIVEFRLSWSSRPTGIDEANIFSIHSDAVDHPKDLAARVSADLATLRGLPGVVDAFADYSYPLAGGGWGSSVHLKPDQQEQTTSTAIYFADEHALRTLGVRLVAGRNFAADEITDRRESDSPQTSVLIVSKALADKLFPAGNALGQDIYVDSGDHPERIVGIVERLQSPMTNSTGPFTEMAEHSTLLPYRPIAERSDYLVRVEPGRMASVMQAAENKLSALDGDRILRTRSMAQVRAIAYRGDHGLVILLVSISAALLLVTGFGIVGLTSYWVAQRRRQIGIRRALGATRRDVVRYFQTENLLIVAAGAGGGIAFAIALNLWLVHSFEMLRMGAGWPAGLSILMLILGQLAVLWPALRAASVPPALATRGA